MLILWWEIDERMRIYEYENADTLDCVHNKFIGEEGIDVEIEDLIIDLGNILNRKDPIYDSSDADNNIVPKFEGHTKIIVTGQM